MRSFEVIPGAGEPCPLVVSVPHAGTWVPPEDADLLVLDGHGLLRDADLHVDRLCAGIPALGVTVIRARVSRYVLDVNRAPDDVDRDACADVERPQRSSTRGLVWRTTTDGHPVLRRPLTRAELDSRIARIHQPYHEALTALLEERRARFGHAILLDAHSMPSTGRPGHTDPGARRADIVPGDVRGASCAPAISRLLHEHFASAGFVVRPNDPYMGGYITRHHGRPARSVHAIQLEVNRDLYMDESTYVFDEHKGASLSAHLDQLVVRLRAVRP